MRPSRAPGPWVRRAFRRVYQELSGRDHPAVVSADDAPTLVRRLAWIDDEVPPRGRRERRHQAHQEWFCAKRYLLALAASGHLDFPLAIHKSESPDFLLTAADGTVTGLEVSEATTEAYQRHLTATDCDGVLHPVGPTEGWSGDEPERVLADLVARGVQAKAAKIAHNAQWQRAARHDLLLYNHGPILAPQPQTLLNRLQEVLVPIRDAHARMAWPRGAPGRISLLTCGVVLYDVLGVGAGLPLPDDAV